VGKSKQSLSEVLEQLLLEQVDAEIAEPTGYVSPRDPKDHVSLGRMKERLSREGIDARKGVPSGLQYELACRAVHLNNERRIQKQTVEAALKRQQKIKDAENNFILSSDK